MSYGGSGVPGVLAAVSFRNGEANLEYSWSGDGGADFRVTGSPPRQRIAATAWYWTVADAHCCPLRKYEFTVGLEKNDVYDYLTELSDNRPWLGVYVEPTNGSPVRVVGVVSGSPAAKAFRVGDLLLGLESPRGRKRGEA